MATFKQKFNIKHNQKKDKSNSISEIAKKSKISVKQAKAIVKKGEAAYFNNPQSVRPQVKSSRQWGVSRLYASVSPGSKSSKIDKEEIKKGKEEYKKNKKKIIM